MSSMEEPLKCESTCITLPRYRGTSVKSTLAHILLDQISWTTLSLIPLKKNSYFPMVESLLHNAAATIFILTHTPVKLLMVLSSRTD